MTITNKQEAVARIAYLEGLIEGTRLFAIWRNGEQLVGCMERELKEVVQPWRDEIERLRNKFSIDQG